MEKEILKQRISVLEKENKTLKLKHEALDDFTKDFVRITGQVCNEKQNNEITNQMLDIGFEKLNNAIKAQVLSNDKVNEQKKERSPIANAISDIKAVIQEIADEYGLDDIEIEVTVKRELKSRERVIY